MRITTYQGKDQAPGKGTTTGWPECRSLEVMTLGSNSKSLGKRWEGGNRSTKVGRLWQDLQVQVEKTKKAHYNSGQVGLSGLSGSNWEYLQSLALRGTKWFSKKVGNPRPQKMLYPP